MVSGFNHNFIYNGEKFHLQAEDCGTKAARIVTHLFKEGTVIASRKMSYSDILKVENLDKVVQELMKDQAREMLRSLRGGEYDTIISGLAKKGELIREKAVMTKTAAPAVDAVKAAVPNPVAEEIVDLKPFAVVEDESDPAEALGLKLAAPWWGQGDPDEIDEAVARAEKGLDLATPWWDKNDTKKTVAIQEDTAGSTEKGLDLAAPWWDKEGSEEPEEAEEAESPEASETSEDDASDSEGGLKLGVPWWNKGEDAETKENEKTPPAGKGLKLDKVWWQKEK